uniref:Uncharacterized protein n=3 Tax=Lepeophtheirus salmonis TaxID=72036 RepID=A0A0K2V5W8_LEPSM
MIYGSGSDISVGSALSINSSSSAFQRAQIVKKAKESGSCSKLSPSEANLPFDKYFTSGHRNFSNKNF